MTSEPMFVALGWVATYLIHSTILIGGIWLVTRWRTISPRTADVLWKLALVGGLLTASLQFGLGLRPALGSVELPAASESAIPTSDSAPAPSIERDVVVVGDGDVVVMRLRDESAPEVPAATAPEPVDHGRWATVMLVGLLLGSGYCMLRLLGMARRLARRLRGRREVLEDPLLETFLGLCARAGLGRRVRLTSSAALGSPVALWRREICIPQRAITDLTPRQQEAMLAHELAHVIRRDPVWSMSAAVIEAVCFFQPLNRLVRRHMRDAAEVLCDDWAVRMTGHGMELAKCLAEVASWLEHGEGRDGLVSAMAGSRSPLVARIRRLVEPQSRTHRGLGRSARVALVLGLLAMLAWIAPGVSRARAPEVPTPVQRNDGGRDCRDDLGALARDHRWQWSVTIPSMPAMPSLPVPPVPPVPPAPPELPELPELPPPPSSVAPPQPVPPPPPSDGGVGSRGSLSPETHHAEPDCAKTRARQLTDRVIMLQQQVRAFEAEVMDAARRLQTRAAARLHRHPGSATLDAGRAPADWHQRKPSRAQLRAELQAARQRLQGRRQRMQTALARLRAHLQQFQGAPAELPVIDDRLQQRLVPLAEPKRAPADPEARRSPADDVLVWPVDFGASRRFL